MKPSFQTWWERLDADLNDLEATLSHYSYEVLNTAPQPGAWSVIQVMHHVRLAEDLSRKYCEKKISHQPELKTAGYKAKVRLWVVNKYLQSPLKKQAPAMIDTPQLPSEMSLDHTLQQWRDSREQLRLYLTNLPTVLVDKEIYKHPFAGRLSTEGMLSFFHAHFKRHERQIKRTIAMVSANYPLKKE